MGLLDSVLGAAVGGALGRGGLGGGAMGGGGGMMGGGRGGGLLASPVVKALLLALAAKAAHEYMTRNRAGGAQQPQPGAAGGALGGVLGSILGGQGGGGLGGLGGLGSLGGLLGGLGGAGVLGELVDQFNRGGQANAMNSWVARGPNQPVQPQALAEALGPDNLAELEQTTGLARPQLLEELARELPDAIDHITPEGRLPSDVELAQTGG